MHNINPDPIVLCTLCACNPVDQYRIAEYACYVRIIIKHKFYKFILNGTTLHTFYCML